MAYISQFKYYYNEDVHPEEINWGSYQYVKLVDIVNNFMLVHTGNHSLINNEERFKAIFHAKQAIRELNFDALKEIKVLEMNVDEGLRYVLPSDYVNWVRVSQEKDGKLFPLTENTQVMSSLAYLRDDQDHILFDEDGNCLSPEHSNLDYDRIINGEMGVYSNKNNVFDGDLGYYYEGKWFFKHSFGNRIGLDTEHANINPKFTIDKRTGVINFFSDMAGELVVLEYVSDGMENGDESKISVNKMFEKYIYAAIRYEILNNKLGVQEYVVARARKDKMALLRNARIRMSNMHPSRLLMVLQGMSKIIK